MRDWLEHLLHEARVVELRHHDGDRWRSGLFDDQGALRAAIRARQDAGNLYTTVNRPHPTVKATNTMGAAALADDDIAVHTRLLFDFDPVRPKGTPSTDVELHAAMQARNALMGRLLSIGWPAPAVACSGNGAHLVYRVRLPVADDIEEMLATLYRGLRQDFSTGTCDFDATVRNPSRIWRLYGTRNRKGAPSHDRPHREALVTVPGLWEAVSPRRVAALAEHYARALRPHPVAPTGVRTQVSGEGDYSSLDVVRWFGAHGMYRRHLGQKKHAVACPWTHEHSSEPGPQDTSTVVWEATTNWPSFHCSHAHCEGRRITDVMQLWSDADAYCSRTWNQEA